MSCWCELIWRGAPPSLSVVHGPQALTIRSPLYTWPYFPAVSLRCVGDLCVVAIVSLKADGEKRKACNSSIIFIRWWIQFLIFFQVYLLTDMWHRANHTIRNQWYAYISKHFLCWFWYKGWSFLTDNHCHLKQYVEPYSYLAVLTLKCVHYFQPVWIIASNGFSPPTVRGKLDWIETDISVCKKRLMFPFHFLKVRWHFHIQSFSVGL